MWIVFNNGQKKKVKQVIPFRNLCNGKIITDYTLSVTFPNGSHVPIKLDRVRKIVA